MTAIGPLSQANRACNQKARREYPSPTPAGNKQPPRIV